MKKVIGLAVFGEKNSYAQYLATSIRAYLTLFPNFEVWIHHDEHFDSFGYAKTLKILSRKEIVRLVPMATRPTQGKCENMLWRLFPAWTFDVSYIFSRDLDALPTWKERSAVEEFISSDFETHTIIDNPAHAGIMGGLCGFKAHKLRNMFSTFEKFISYAKFSDERWAQHGADQDYLNGKLAPYLHILEHTIKGRSTIPISEHRPINGFIDDRVSLFIADKSMEFVPYLGVAGYDRAPAIDFYNRWCPKNSDITSAEKQSGEHDC